MIVHKSHLNSLGFTFVLHNCLGIVNWYEEVFILTMSALCISMTRSMKLVINTIRVLMMKNLLLFQYHSHIYFIWSYINILLLITSYVSSYHLHLSHYFVTLTWSVHREINIWILNRYMPCYCYLIWHVTDDSIIIFASLILKIIEAK